MAEYRNTLEYCALAALALDGGHGYDLFKDLTKRLGTVCKLGRSQVYGLLKKLETNGLIEHYKVPQENLPTKKVYRITRKGREELDMWLSEPALSLRDMRMEFFLKKYFAEYLSEDRGFELLGSQKRILDKNRRKVSQMKDSAHTWIEREALDFRETMLNSAMEWLEKFNLQESTIRREQ